MPVFPESMNKIDPANPEASLRTIDNYIRYMSERVEFSNQKMARNMNVSGQNTEDILELMNSMASAMSAMQSTINGLRDALTAQSEAVNEAASAASAAQSAATNAQSAATQAAQTAEAMQNQHKAGSYDGNGDAATRTVDVGGGTALLVYDASGIMAIVTAAGMHYMSSTTQPTYKDATIASFSNGTLTLNTASYINVSGRTYSYQVL